ncbi:phosphatases II [Ramaria rubella]|nr:phosphatases II [Ramaria rubella]
MSQPTWLQSSFQQSHLSFALRTLQSREELREYARSIQPSNPQFHYHYHRDIPPLVKEYYSCSVGQQPSHRRKNRYHALEPYDRTRVLIPTPRRGDSSAVGTVGGRADEERYLNANWVRESAGGKWWIAGQAPLPTTAHAFLTLCMCTVAPPYSVSSSAPRLRVWTIVQLTLEVERGQRRAHPYFSGSLREHMVINAESGCNAPSIHVFVDGEERIEAAQCVKTNLRLRWAGAEEGQTECRVTHLLYTAWPDFGVPSENSSILAFARLVERVNNRNLQSNDSSPPVLVHCSAGVGRTGSFIALSSLLRAHSLLSSRGSPSLIPALAAPLPMSPLGSLPGTLKDDLVVKEVDSLREQRQSMVQRDEQVVWVYEALSQAFEGS